MLGLSTVSFKVDYCAKSFMEISWILFFIVGCCCWSTP